MARTPVSGIQHSLRAGEYEAIIASVGASLRSLTHGGRDLVVAFDADELRPGFRGATLAPWPNRVVDGTYTFGGVDYSLALTEHPYYQHTFGWRPEDMPHATRVGRQTVSLPISAKLTDEDVADVISAVRLVLR